MFRVKCDELQFPLFSNDAALPLRHALPMVGEQKDIQYFASRANSILNSPAATGMPFWSINPYIGCAFGCAYCYARYAHRYRAERLQDSATINEGEALPTGELPPWLAFERRILVKPNAAYVLRRSLMRPSIASSLQRETVVIGTATDPYQPAERRFRITRALLEVLAEQRGLSVTIITKSPLVTRDIDLLERIRDRSAMHVHISLITVDRDLARRLEPRAPTPEARLRAMKRLREHGIDVGVNCMPVLPGITDSLEQIDALVAGVALTSANYIGACALRLRRTARERYIPFIEQEFPALAPRYRKAYATGHQINDEYRSRLRERFVAACERHAILFGRDRTVDEAETPPEVPPMEQHAMAL